MDAARGPEAARARLAPWGLRHAPHAALGAFCLGLIGALAPSPPRGAAMAGLVVVGAAFAVAVRRARAGWAIGLLLALAVGAGLTWGGARLAATRPPVLAVPATVEGGVVVDAPARPGRHGWTARAVAERLRAGGRAVPDGTRVLLEVRGTDRRPAVGTRLRVRGTLEDAAGRDAPGWWRGYLARQRIAARLRARSARADGRRGGLAGARDAWRAWAGDHVARGLDGDRAALVRGMALGGTTTLSEAAGDAFRDAGMWHLLAVSGQNVAVVALAVLAALRALGVGRRPAVAASGVVLVAYCLACDGGASVARAGAVGALGVAGELGATSRLRWHLLLGGLAAILAVDPRAIGDPGLQLSFAAVVGLFLLAPPLAAWLRGALPPRVADLAAQAAAAGLATAPVVALRFERLSLAGLVVNVVAVPLAAPIVVLALAGAPAAAVLPAAGAAAAWLAGLGAAALLAIARAAAAVPGAAVDLPGWAAAPLTLVAAAPLIVDRRLRAHPRPSGSGPRPGGRPRLAGPALAAAAGAGLWLAWPRPAPPAAPWPAQPAMTVLDVGQGDAVLIRDPGGAAALLDTGPPASPAPVVAALRRAGVRRLGAVVLSHGSADHVGGLADVLAAVPVGRVLIGGSDGDSPGLRGARAAARAAGVPWAPAVAGDALRVGGWTLRAIGPRGPRPGDANSGSLVLLGEARGMRALLPTDAESDALAPLDPPPVAVLNVGHHGSADPGLPDLLERLRPAVAIVSVGAGNPYGHPRASTLAALAASGARVTRTDRDGDVTVMAGPGGVPELLRD